MSWGVASFGALAFPSYRWETRALAPCPVTCGGGQVLLAVRCVRLDHGRSIPLPHAKCWPVPRPGPFEDCSPEPCPARWAPPQGGRPGRASREVPSSPPSSLLTLGVLACRGALKAVGGLMGLCVKRMAPDPGCRRCTWLMVHFFITCSLLSTCYDQALFWH